jgi:hypothetical protein
LLCAFFKARFVYKGKRNLRTERAKDVTLKYWLGEGDQGLQEEPYWFHFERDNAESIYKALNIVLISKQGDFRQSSLKADIICADEYPKKPIKAFAGIRQMGRIPGEVMIVPSIG